MLPPCLARLRPTTRLLLLIGVPLGGILALGSGFNAGEWGLVVLGTVVLTGMDLWDTRPRRRKETPDVASVRDRFG